MHDYVTRGLGYSDSAAFRRIRAARAVALYTEISGMIERGELSLCAVAKISGALTPGNRVELLRRVTGKRLREIDAILAENTPAILVRDKLKPIGIVGRKRRPAESDALFDTDPARPVSDRRNGGREVTTPSAHATPPEVTTPGESREPSDNAAGRYRIEFSVSAEFAQQFARVRALVSNGIAGQSYEGVFGKLISEYLARHDPARRQARREKRNERTLERRGSKSMPEPAGDCHGLARGALVEPGGASMRDRVLGQCRSRHIPAALRDEIMLRDGRRCTFIARDGTRCNATRHLQIDHITPFALGGRHEASNLRLLCGAHNRLEAERAGLERPERRSE